MGDKYGMETAGVRNEKSDDDPTSRHYSNNGLEGERISKFVSYNAVLSRRRKTRTNSIHSGEQKT